MLPEILFPKFGSKRPPFLTNDQKSRPKYKAYRQSKTCKRETNGPRDLKLGLKIIPRVSFFRSKMSPEIIFPKLGSKRPPFLTNDQKSRHKYKAYRQSKTCKRGTNGPRDLKLGLKIFPRVSFW